MSIELISLTAKRPRRLAKFLMATVLCFAILTLSATTMAAFSWEPTNGPYGGHIFDLAVNASGHVFAASETNGVFRSTDNGSSWTQVTSTEVDPLVINSSGHIFAGTNDGVLISTDNGDTWSSTGLVASGIVSLVINSSDHIFAGNYFGDVYRSTDNGANWSTASSGLTANSVEALAVNASDHIYAGTDVGVFLSTDNGDSWTKTSLAATNVTAVIVNGGDDVFAGTISSGVYRSTDDGASWTQVLVTSASVKSFAESAGGSIFAAAAAGGVYRSTDNGDSWTLQVDGLRNIYGFAVATYTGGLVYVGTYGGVYRSANSGDTWAAASGGLMNNEIVSLEINTSDYLFAGTNGDGLYRSADDGANWIHTELTNASVPALTINSSGHLFAGTGCGVLRSTDNGDTWTGVDEDLPGPGYNALEVTSTDILFVGTATGVYRSSDNGDNWALVGLSGGYISALAVNASNHIFAGTFDGNGIYRSVDNGDNWTQINTGLTDLYIFAIAVSSSGDIWAATGADGIFRSTDNGDTWTQAGLASQQVRAVAVNSDDDIFAGTSTQGIYRSNDNGATWMQENDGLTYSMVGELAVNSSDVVFAGTYGASVFKGVDVPIMVTFLDGAGPPQPIVSTSVDLYRVDEYLSETFVTTVTTDGDGKAALPDAFEAGDRIKAYKVLHTESTGRPAGYSPDMYAVEIDNGKFNVVTGELSYDEVTGADQSLILDHTTIAFDLLVYIEWEANATYLDNFAEGMRLACNYLYDVADGQARIRNIEVYDDQVMGYDWVFRSGTNPDFHIRPVPNAAVGTYSGDTRYSRVQFLTPKNFGYRSASIAGLYSEYPLDLSVPNDYRLKGYALGHLAFAFGSEHSSVAYNSAFWPIHSPRYGFMESPLETLVSRSSEMSRSAVEYATAPAQNTFQWTYYTMGCMEKFEKDFEGDYSGIYAQIYRPDERGVAEFEGPNDDPAVPTVDCGALVNFTVHDASDGGMDVAVAFDARLRYRTAYLSSPGNHGRVAWGLTNSSGQVLLRGARVGDIIYTAGSPRVTIQSLAKAAGSSAGEFEWYCSDVEITSAGPITADVTAVDGDFPLAHLVGLEPGSLEYEIVSASALPGGLTLELIPDGETGESIVMTPTDPGTYVASFTADPGTAGTFMLETVDDAANTFFVINPYVTHEYDDALGTETVSDPFGDAQIALDSLSKVGKSLFVMSTDYPPPPDGLPNGAIQVGPIVCFTITGTDLLVGDDTLTMYYDDDQLSDLELAGHETDLGIWKWNADSSKWTAMTGTVDSDANMVTAEISETGTYAIFAEPGCCQNIRGNANGDPDDKINISDVTYLLDYLFGIPSGPAPPCLEEGNANGDIDEKTNISDVSYLLTYLFGIPTGPVPPACP